MIGSLWLGIKIPRYSVLTEQAVRQTGEDGLSDELGDMAQAVGLGPSNARDTCDS